MKKAFIGVIIAVILMSLLEGSLFVVGILAISWVVGQVFGLSVNYLLIGGISTGIYLIKFLINLITVTAAKLMAKSIDDDYESWKQKNGWR